MLVHFIFLGGKTKLFPANCCLAHGFPETLSQPELEARKRREARESKPAREWTAEERREAFRKAREAERRKAEASVLDEWDLCDECHENLASGVCFGAASASTAVVNMQIDADEINPPPTAGAPRCRTLA